MSLDLRPEEDRVIRFTIFQLTPSLNQLLRMHYRKRKRLKDSFLWEIKANLFEQDLEIEPSPPKRRLSVVSYRKKLLDQDNYIGGLKLLIDSLVDLGLVSDDSPEFLELERLEQRKDLINSRTEICIS